MTTEINDLGARQPVDLAKEKPFHLAGLEVRPATREVRGEDLRETLEPRVMQVLVALTRAKGETVTRDDLTESCWEGRIVSEDAINRVISRIRRLAETTGGWSVETITKVGYRIAETGAAAPKAPTTAEQRRAAGPVSRRGLIAAGGAAAAGAAAYGIWRLTRPPRAPPEVEALVARARGSLDQDDVVARSHAVSDLRRAVAEAPTHSEAWGLLALAYFESSSDVPASQFPGLAARSEDAARRALDLNPRDANALTARALFIPRFRNWAAAERAMDPVIAIAPHHPVLRAYQGALLAGVGRCQDGLAAILRAQSHQAASPRFAFVLGSIQWAAGRLEEADRTFTRGLETWPRYYALWFLHFWVLTYSGRADEAIAFASNQTGRPAGIPTADFDLVISAARAASSRAQADIAAAVAAHRAAARRGTGYAANAIEVCSFLGDVDASLEVARALYLGEGYQIGSAAFSTEQSDYRVRSRLDTWQLFRPATVNLRADPRFLALCRDVGLEDYWRQSGHQPDYRRAT
jgi:DNA-binding winged helix-turn-helix (wHTH) protein/tetratricopeptide (TPR) repeat protein